MAGLLGAPLPGAEHVGEAWLLSDRDDPASLVADGPLKGKTLGALLALHPQALVLAGNGALETPAGVAGNGMLEPSLPPRPIAA